MPQDVGGVLVHEGAAGGDQVRQRVERSGVVDETDVADGEDGAEVVGHGRLKCSTPIKLWLIRRLIDTMYR